MPDIVFIPIPLVTEVLHKDRKERLSCLGAGPRPGIIAEEGRPVNWGNWAGAGMGRLE